MIGKLLINTNVLPPADQEAVNIADSVKVTAKAIAQEMMADPATFANNVLQELLDFGLKLLAAILIYIIGAWFIRRIKRTLAKVLEKRKTEKTVASFVSSLVSIVLTLLLVVLTVSTLGVNTTSIAALLGAGAVAIGMALSGTMENLAGGLIILLFKPFKAGDFISVDGFSGTVTEVTIVSTKIATPDNRVVVIPNGSMSNGKIDNYSQRPTRRMDIKVNVEYGTDAEQCCNALMEIAKADPRVLTEPAPVSMLSQMKESDVEFVLRVWVKSEDYWDAWFALNKEVYTTLPKKGCPFAYPHMDVTVSSK